MAKLLPNTQLGYMRQILPFEVFLVDVVVDVHCLVAGVASQFLDVLPLHSRSAEMGGIPVAAAMRREMVLHVIRIRIVQTHFGRPVYEGVVDAAAHQPLAFLMTDEQCL